MDLSALFPFDLLSFQEAYPCSPRGFTLLLLCRLHLQKAVSALLTLCVI